MRVVFVAALASLLVACSSSSSPSSCVQGASVSCSCANGKTGAQVCASDGTLGACSCDTGTGTGGSGSGTGGATSSGGTTGTGGSSGHGGATGTGGVTSTGGVTGTGGTTGTGGSGAGNTAQFMVMYAGGPTSTLTTCYSCMGYYFASPRNEGDMTFGMQNSGGGLHFTTVSFAVRPATAGGNEINLGLTEDNTSFAAQFQGMYNLGGAANVWVPVQGSCVTFNTLSIQQGGAVSGSLNCTLPGGSATTPIAATVTGTFSGVF